MTYPIYILGIRENFRGESLCESLHEFKLLPEIVYGPEVESDRELIEQLTNQNYAQYCIGRKIKPQEVACTIGHLRMYSKFFDTQEEWGLFLEDDAICLVNPTHLLGAMPVVKEPCHVFVHDGPGTNLNLKISRDNPLGKMEMVRRLDPQYGAYGYLLNRAAVELILKSKVISHINTPDWPYLWPASMRFYKSKIVYFTHPKDLSMSIIGERVNAEAKFINQLPNFLRIRAGIEVGLSAREVYHKEITMKLLRLFYQTLRKLGFTR